MNTLLTPNKNNNLYVLAFCEFMERFINFGVFTVLVLKLKQSFHLSDGAALAIFGLYATLSYAMLILGGIIADKWLGARQAILVGGVLLILSTLALSINSLGCLYIGLSILVMGTALFKVNCTSLVGTLWQNNEKNREHAFTFLYCCMNLGAVFGPLVYGLIATHFGWTYCFWLSAILIMVALLIFKQNVYFKETQLPTSASPWVYLSLLLICGIIFLLFLYPTFKNIFLILLVIGILGFFSKTMRHYSNKIKKNIIGIFLVNSLCVCFFICSFQIATSITLFINSNVNRMIGSWSVPTVMFSALDPLFVVLTAPLFYSLWKYLAVRQREPNAITKIAIGLAFAGVAFMLLSFAALNVQTHHWLVLSLIVIVYLCLGAGEICLVPAVLSTISRYSPTNIKSTLMGSLYLFVAASGYIAGYIATVEKNQSELIIHTQIYSSMFSKIALFAFISSLIAMVLKSVMPRLFTAETN